MDTQNLVKEARLKLALTQQEVAEKVAGKSGSCNVKTYSTWENGQRTPRLRQQRALAEVLGIDLGILRAFLENPFSVERSAVA